MKTYALDPDDLTIGRTSAIIPSSMEQDTNADEEVIDQQAGQTYPEPVQENADTDQLASSIAYALDGSGPGLAGPGLAGPGPTGNQPQDVPHKLITEGTTGAGPDDEEAAVNEWQSL